MALIRNLLGSERSKLILFFAVLSLARGRVGGVRVRNLKVLQIYRGIFNLGFVLLVLTNETVSMYYIGSYLLITQRIIFVCMATKTF